MPQSLIISSKSVVGLHWSQFCDLMNRIIPLIPKTESVFQLSLEDKVIATLIRLRHGVTFNLLAFIMKVHKSTAVRAWEFVIPLLHTVVTPSINLNQGTPIEFMNTTFRYVVDGFEHRVSASSNKTIEKFCYSVKKKQHSFTQLIFTTFDGRICWISSSYAGSTSDSTIVSGKENHLMEYLKPNEFILGDSGFAGLEHLKILSSMVNETSYEICLWNWMVKKYRIVVENAIAEIKNWKLMKNEYQMNPFNLDKELKIHNYILSIVCGLVNMYTDKRRHSKFFDRVCTLK
jgi:hypothetical protein